MNILFRADSSSTIGTGHIMRDLVLAQQYKDSHIIFATQDLKGNINGKIDYKIVTLKSNALDELIEVVKEHKIDMVVIDHYDIDWEFEKQLKEKTGVKILSFDDTYERHCCDILLNQSIHAQKEKYKKLVSQSTKLLCGKEYIMIRDSFYAVKYDDSLVEEGYILVSLGGGQIENIVEMIVEYCVDVGSNYNIVLVSPQLDNLATKTMNLIYEHNIKTIKYTNEMPSIIKKASLVICSLGMITYEVMFLNKKFIGVQTMDNQQKIADYLQKLKIPIIKKDTTSYSVFKNSIEEVFYNKIPIYKNNLINPKKEIYSSFL